jgi:hypothetical protein
VGRLAVDVREPPCPNLAGWLALAGGLSTLGVSGEIPLDLHGEGQDCTNDEQEDAEADPHRHASSDIAGLPSGLLSAGDAVL